MINVKLKDNSVLNIEKGTQVIDVARGISDGLARVAMCATINGNAVDLRTPIIEDCNLNILTFKDKEGREAFRHTASHILAQAVLRLYPAAKLAIGPAIENGFYYDVDIDITFQAEDLLKIEQEMKKIVKEGHKIERYVLPKNDAIDLMQSMGQDYKVELIRCLPEGEEISFYKQGEFVDLCCGPHLLDIGKVKAIKLLSATGAYWRGDSNNKMLQRIYGTAFTKNSELEEYLTAVEEAKKRDHNKIGRELQYFTTVDIIGQGLPIMLPKGARVIQLLQRFVEDEEEKRGYLLTKTPLMAKSDLYKISGHWQHYKDGMFVMGDEGVEGQEVFALRPMTCPFQFQAYNVRGRSYRDLPMRLAETSTLFRNESSGEMHGLIRVRQFTISEGHIACTPCQLEEEFRGCVDLAKYMLKTLGLDDDVYYRFSKWDAGNKEKYIGDAGQWEDVQNKMSDILKNLDIDFTESEGEAAFYGPKLDIQIRNVHGKEDTIVTIQIDFQLAERFGMDYVDRDGTKKYPYVIHRTSIGCYERTLALLLEKYAGALPLWISPEQVRILPVTDRNIEYSKRIKSALDAAGFRVSLDDRSEKVGYKIREAQLEKVNYMLVLGDRDEEAGIISVRDRRDGETQQFKLDDFIDMALQDIRDRKI